MKKFLKIFLKIVKWSAIAIFIFYFLGIAIFGISKSNRNGTWDYYWSGIEAMWNENEEFGFFRNKKMVSALEGIDGPYILGDLLFKVNKENKLEKVILNKTDTIPVFVNNAAKDHFEFVLKASVKKETDHYALPRKLIAISDIEGNFNAFASFLHSSKVIDEEYNWTFADGHLVLNGDFVDRGSDVTQVLWLIYKLEGQAEKQGGKVHFILGNHEIMNFQGDWRYNQNKYMKLAQLISRQEDWDKAVQYMYSEKTELGKWLRSKNVVEKIGNYLFVHAGLSPEIIQYNLPITEINTITRKNWDKNLYNYPGENEVANFLIGPKGPFWYRGLVINYKYYDKITEAELAQVLNFYQAEKIVIGHTLVEDISTDFNGKLLRIDMKHGKKKYSGKTKGVLIENGMEYKIDDKGVKTKI